MKIPNVSQCYELLNEIGALPENIIRHSEQVTKVALYIGRKIKVKGEKINLELLRAACLLHDIVKPVDFKDFESKPEFNSGNFSEKQIKTWKKLKEEYVDFNHEEIAEKIITEKGYPEVGKLILSHGYFKIIDSCNTWEEKILYYSDQCVKNYEIVSLKERLEDGHKRYIGEKPWPKEVKETDELIFALEKEIFKTIGEDPNILLELNNKSFVDIVNQSE